MADEVNQEAPRESGRPQQSRGTDRGDRGDRGDRPYMDAELRRFPNTNQFAPTDRSAIRKLPLANGDSANAVRSSRSGAKE